MLSISRILIRECRKFFSAFLSACILFVAIICTSPAFAQSIPDDLAIDLSSASVHTSLPPGIERITISSDGSVEISEMDSAEGLLAPMSFQLDSEALVRIYSAIQDHDFFTLNERYRDEAIEGGDYARLEITAGGQKHIVRTTNIRLSDFDAIVIAINREMPGERIIVYNALHVEAYRDAER